MIRRVLMTADAVGGVWPYALELARALGEHGVETMLAVMGPSPSAAQRAQALAVPGLRLEDRPFALEWMPRPWADVDRAGPWLLELEARWQPDVCHFNGYSHAGNAFRAPRVVVAHSCICSWHEAVHGSPAPGSASSYRRRVTQGLAAADAVVAPTRWMLDEVQRQYGPQHRAQVIPNARSAESFVATRKEPIVFAAGRVWDEAKNLATLDRAAAALRWPVIIAGSVDYEGAAPGVFRHSRLLGQLEPAATARWLARATIYALPARYEPFGLSVLEAALSGCALVLGDIPSLRETWSGAALFVDPSDPAQLTAQLEWLISEPLFRAELACRAFERALRFTPRAQAAAYLAVYHLLAAQDASRAAAP